MIDLYEFMGNHPVLTFFLAAIIITPILRLPYRFYKTTIRHMNIRAHGWPPNHLDADGDFKPEKDES